MENLQSTQEVVEHPSGCSLFTTSAISLHLSKLGYPEKSIQSMLKCGTLAGHMLKSCGCGNELITLKHRCNLRTCPACAKLRKIRLRRQYLPFLTSLAQDKTYSIYFLTISPKNYEDFEKGQEHIRKSFVKFLRHNYLKKRIKAGLYVLETKQSNTTNWNIHIHCIVYGRRLDNQIRGKCFGCGQNLIKQDYITKKYYCANKKCNSKNVIFHQNSKLVELFKQSSKRDVHIDIRRQNNAFGSLNYMLKYISVNKGDFSSSLKIAEYIKGTYKRKLINVFGLFFKYKFGKIKCVCWKCNKEISFCYDYEVIFSFMQSIKPPNFQRGCY